MIMIGIESWPINKEVEEHESACGRSIGTIPEELYLHLMKQCLTRMLWRRDIDDVGQRVAKARIETASIAVESGAAGSCQN
jgi:hypothetical protein